MIPIILALNGFGAGKSIPSFPHSKHIQSLGCLDCHERSGQSADVALPDGSLCRSCHDNDPEHTVSSRDSRRVGAHLTFSHSRHITLECGKCHDAASSSIPTKPSPETCMACHVKNGKKPECTLCHTKSNKPNYHTGIWAKTHGFRNDISGPVKKHGWDCDTCHQASSCVRCHQTMKPSSHTGFFRTRGHGLRADVESQSCRTCHTEGACIQCHRVSKPLNHNAAFRYNHGFAVSGGLSGSYGRCVVCHKESWCRTCHNR
jgi:hypothetical protein